MIWRNVPVFQLLEEVFSIVQLILNFSYIYLNFFRFVHKGAASNLSFVSFPLFITITLLFVSVIIALDIEDRFELPITLFQSPFGFQSKVLNIGCFLFNCVGGDRSILILIRTSRPV